MDWLLKIIDPESQSHLLAQTVSYGESGFDAILPYLKLLAVVVTGISAFVLVVIKIKASQLKAGPEVASTPSGTLPMPAPTGAMRARWEEIIRHLNSPKEAEWKFAVIEADKLLELVLQRAGFVGGGLGEKLMNIQPGQFQNLEGLWMAHKIRNRLAHDVNYFLRYSEARQAVEEFEKVLIELGAI